MESVGEVSIYNTMVFRVVCRQDNLLNLVKTLNRVHGVMLMTSVQYRANITAIWVCDIVAI